MSQPIPSTPKITPFDDMLRLQLRAFELCHLAYGLKSVIDALSDVPGVGNHPGIAAAETLIELISDKAHDLPDGIERIYGLSCSRAQGLSACPAQARPDRAAGTRPRDGSAANGAPPSDETRRAG
ncbi:hypothetical protein [Roseibium algae]|uniref:Uncharacterized protein n=1 Tax=Roseibium algae TaxID=3123038 RepID=A0ABU8TJY9_9HYPH